MQRYIAFLSGLPVGRGAVEMTTLRRLFTQLGFMNVETFLTTGNVSFETAPVGNLPPLEAQISRHLERKLGHDIGVYIRTPKDLEAIVAHQPFPSEDLEAPGTSVFVILLPSPVSEKTERKLRFNRSDADDFHAKEREVYWLRRDLSDNAHNAPPFLAEILGVPATVRGIGTLRKLAGQIQQGIRTATDPTASARSRR